ncbi:MAG: hypothetical protein R3A80_05835 [Bdellovibrionota bacterium]
MTEATPPQPSYFEKFLELHSPSSSYANKIPEKCPSCGCKEFYKQSDFKRAIGLWLVSIASILTMVLMAMGYGWFTIWSPMFFLLIFDRTLNGIRPLAAICYQCKHVVRGISKKDLEEIDGFELEIYDRYKYKEEHSS